VSLPEFEDDGPQVLSSPVKEEEEKAEPQLTADEVVEDSMIFEPAEVAPAPNPSGTPAEEGPSTPRRSSRLSQARAQETPTPKSEGDEFVDAPTSPVPPTPKRSERAAKASEVSDGKQPHAIPADNTSFDISDVDETSLLRLVVELDSGKADRSEYHRPSPSVSPDGKGQRSPVIDCIVVGDSPQKAEAPPPTRKTRASSTASAVSSRSESQNIPSSQTKGRVGRPKRKRTLSKAQGTSPKRQRHESVEESGDASNSQTAVVEELAVEVQASAEMPAVIAEDVTKEETTEERIPSSSAEPSSSESLSQEEHGSQESAVAETGDAMDLEADDLDVQSQIALEFSQHQVEEDSSPASEEASPSPIPIEEPLQVEIQQPITNEQEDDEVAITTADSATEVEEITAPETNQVQKIMDLFRGGLDELRSAQLSREEVYQIEDMFMDMRRELYEAERRGRA
jgi:hypothetical protein